MNKLFRALLGRTEAGRDAPDATDTLPPPAPLGVVLKHPARFFLQVLKGFRANQGFLLAGAVAYYTLLSIIPLFALMLVILSKILDPQQVLDTLGRFAGLLVPGEREIFMTQVRAAVADNKLAFGLVFTLLFFGSMAFTILENAISVIFFHRVAVRRRHFMISALLPYVYILFFGVGLLFVTVIASLLQSMGEGYWAIRGHELGLDRLSFVLIYVLSLAAEIVMLTAIYFVMPVGRLPLRHALVGGAFAGLLWEVARRVLVWYFGTLSTVGEVYGPLTAVIVALLTLEVGSIIVLIGAQVIAEYERLGRLGAVPLTAHEMKTS